MQTTTSANVLRRAARRLGSRHALWLFGWLNVGLGLIGVVVPLMPTTVFLLIALWAFSQSSPRFHNWLYHHPRFGPALQAWHRDRAIPLAGKILAVVAMTASVVWLALYSDLPGVAIAAVGAGLAFLATWIVTRPTATRRV